MNAVFRRADVLFLVAKFDVRNIIEARTIYLFFADNLRAKEQILATGILPHSLFHGPWSRETVTALWFIAYSTANQSLD